MLKSFRIRPQVEDLPPPVTPSALADISGDGARRRLSGPDALLDQRLLPFRRHWPDRSWHEDWRLYWLPASFENQAATRVDPRFLQVYEKLILFVTEKVPKARGLTFFDTQLVYPHLIEHTILNAIEYLPLPAMGFYPSRGPASVPKYDEIRSIDFRAVYKKLKEKKEAFRPQDAFPKLPKQLQYIIGDQDMARRNLMGRGGYTFFLSTQKQGEFTEIGKRILADNTSDPMMQEIPMPVPLLDSAAFMTARAEQLESYFSLFELYVAESPADNGYLIAATHDLDERLPEWIEAAGYRQAKSRRGFWSRS